MESPTTTATAWEVYPQLTGAQFQAAKRAGIDQVLAQLLANRGVETVEQMQRFLRADYNYYATSELVDMQKAVKRILQALQQGDHITVYGDYDADGVTSSALLYRALRILRGSEERLDFYIPHRQNDGCGLNLAALDLLKQRGTQLIITTDCASSDVEQVDYAHQLGLEVIITDHHNPPAVLPAADAMINPWRPGGSEESRVLCGAGVAFKLVQALYQATDRPQQEAMALLDLAAIGTIADVAPLIGENHMLAKRGLQRLNTTQNPGLKALIQRAQFRSQQIRERDIAFGIAPRINAAGRMKEAALAFHLLTTEDEQEAERFVDELDGLNVWRQQETETLMQSVRLQARQQTEKTVVLVQGDNWHEGIIGLVAGKLAEEINKPVLVLSHDLEKRTSRGSGRSQKGFNLIKALRAFAVHLERYGGHAQAAGFTIRSEYIAILHDHLEQWQENDDTDLASEEHSSTEQESSELITVTAPKVDLVFTRLEKITYQLYEQIRELAPFGASNPEPIFRMNNVTVSNVKPSYNKLHLTATMSSSNSSTQLAATFYRAAARVPEFEGVTHANIIFKLEPKEYGRRPEVKLRLLDIEPLPTQA